ncbi:zinc ABC transporter substrate-binding protein [Pseudomonas sp. MAFF 302046]|jgi:ABC-type Zn uptake system ZnuABC Zn-binding protein ZnuA|uniref:Zinc ABC transporter substrate-binding protein n=1 Tax=Pseudomonas morbosilactucae TaxID=2938197 RepID=A0ABT0JH99_9PSED|nr:zinc ABC transporter substrate-binding protein [Pseudomonas morbosilactucae]MCK9815285.1 zinc ABC transporter substrate-binding protein [Pseudomonas morbosilactucae]
MPTVRSLTLALALTGLFSASLSAADANPQVRVLASLPITYGLSDMLLKGSDVKLERAAAANLPGSRQSAYFSGRGAEALQKLAVNADAVVGLRSVWSDDPLYPMARRSNIRIVEIDAARPVDGGLPGIAVQPGKVADSLNSQPWLASNNMGRMADVIAADLVRLAPKAKPSIETNLARFKQRLLKLSADSEARLGQADNLSVVSLSDHFAYLIGGLNLELIQVDARADDQWTPEALKQLSQTLKDSEVKLVLDHRQPADNVKAAIAESGSTLVVLDTDGSDPLAGLEGSIKQILDTLAPL